MFILDTNPIPASTTELTAAIDRSLRQTFHETSKAPLVKISGKLPRLTSMVVTLTDATIDMSQGLPPYETKAASEAGPVVGSLRVTADPLYVDTAAMHFELSAEDVSFGYARGAAGKLVATLEDAKNGMLAIQVSHQHLETAVLGAIQTIAAGTGLAVQNVDVSLTSIGPRDLGVTLKITAKKFITTVVTVSGHLAIDDELNATASDLKAEGDGMVGSIAVAFLRPHLQKFNGQPIPLMAFSLGKVRLHDIAVKTDDGLEITAEFGSAKPR